MFMPWKLLTLLFALNVIRENYCYIWARILRIFFGQFHLFAHFYLNYKNTLTRLHTFLLLYDERYLLQVLKGLPMCLDGQGDGVAVGDGEAASE